MTITVYTASDEAMEYIQAVGRRDGEVVIDARKPLWRRVKATLWAIFIVYALISNYCYFKMALGYQCLAHCEATNVQG